MLYYGGSIAQWANGPARETNTMQQYPDGYYWAINKNGHRLIIEIDCDGKYVFVTGNELEFDISEFKIICPVTPPE